MRFEPSAHSYGDEAAAPVDASAVPAPATSSGLATEEYAKGVRALLGLQDARQALEQVQWKIDAINKQLLTAKGLTKKALQLSLNSLEAKKKVLLQQSTEQRISDTSSVVTRIGVAGMAVGGVIVIGLLGRYLYRKG